MSYIRSRLKLAFLTPAIQRAILEGRQPIDVSVERIVRKPMLLEWDAQARMYGLRSIDGVPDLNAALPVPAENLPVRWDSIPC